MLEQGYVRFWTEGGKPQLLGTVDPISGLPHTHGGLSGSSGKVTYRAHEQHGLRASLFNGDDDDDTFGNHGHESFAVNLSRGSWRYSTPVAHFDSRRKPLQELADKLAEMGVIDSVLLPEFVASERMKSMWQNSRVDPLEAVARDPEMPRRMEGDLKAARKEVQDAANDCPRAQAKAAKDAKAQNALGGRFVQHVRHRPEGQRHLPRVPSRRQAA